MRRYLPILFVAVAMMSSYGGLRTAAQPSAPADSPFFNPSFGDLMNTLVQPRHAKLGIIAREQNWPLAAYEVHQIKDALANVAKWRPRFRNMSVADLMQSTVAEPIKALEQAAQAANAPEFAAAYDRLTAGCNACHAALGHGHVVIQAPDQSTFLNQNFRAKN